MCTSFGIARENIWFFRALFHLSPFFFLRESTTATRRRMLSYHSTLPQLKGYASPSHFGFFLGREAMHRFLTNSFCLGLKASHRSLTKVSASAESYASPPYLGISASTKNAVNLILVNSEFRIPNFKFLRFRLGWDDYTTAEVFCKYTTPPTFSLSEP